MLTTLLLAGATVAAAAITFGGLIKKLLSAPVIVYVAASGYFLNAYAATGTISGLTVGVLSILLVSIVIRAWRYLLGYERLTVNGDARFSTVASHLITATASWVRQTLKSLFTGAPVVAPTFNFTWDYVPGAAYKIRHALPI